jgi:hypothetical protein
MKSYDPDKSHHNAVLTISKSHATFLINEQSRLITLFDLDRDVGMVEENYTKRTAIIFVNNIDADVDEVVDIESGL